MYRTVGGAFSRTYASHRRAAYDREPFPRRVGVRYRRDRPSASSRSELYALPRDPAERGGECVCECVCV